MSPPVPPGPPPTSNRTLTGRPCTVSDLSERRVDGVGCHLSKRLGDGDGTGQTGDRVEGGDGTASTGRLTVAPVGSRTTVGPGRRGEGPPRAPTHVAVLVRSRRTHVPARAVRLEEVHVAPHPRGPPGALARVVSALVTTRRTPRSVPVRPPPLKAGGVSSDVDGGPKGWTLGPPEGVSGVGSRQTPLPPPLSPRDYWFLEGLECKSLTKETRSQVS